MSKEYEHLNAQISDLRLVLKVHRERLAALEEMYKNMRYAAEALYPVAALARDKDSWPGSAPVVINLADARAARDALKKIGG